MSYCQPCRRHLNGAPECPGCGTPAEEIRNSAGPSATDDSPSGADTEHTGHTGRPAARRHRGGSRPVHRRKRRRVLLVSAGVVLGLGALTMARITTEVPSPDDGNSAASTDTGVVGEDGPVGDTASPSSSSSASPSAGDASASASASTSPEPSGSDAGADDKASGRDGTDGSGTGGSHSDTPPPATHDPAPTSEPAPSPTRTCVDWVVVKWCP